MIKKAQNLMENGGKKIDQATACWIINKRNMGYKA